jgi:N-acetylglucosamine-6-sulfatase
MRPPRARRAVAALAVAVAALAVGCGSDSDGDQAERPPVTNAVEKLPNFVFVISDDQSQLTFNRRVMPKTFRLLRDGGTAFPNSIVSSNLCCPARAGILTGDYPHNTGVVNNHPGYPDLRDPESILPAWLQAAGYRTGLVGKFMNGYEEKDPAPGFDYWQDVYGNPAYYDYELSDNGQLEKFGDKPHDYLTRVLTTRADEFLRHAAGQRPFFLWLSYYAPHLAKGFGGRCTGNAPTPDPRDLDRFRNSGPPDTPSFNERRIGDKRPKIAEQPRLDRHQVREEARNLGCSMAAMRGVDRGIEQLVQTLRQSGEDRDTVIVFVADNGTFYGEHRIYKGKGDPYEEGIHVPMLMLVPGDVLGRRPASTVPEPVANIDLAPTMLDLASARPCTAEDQCREPDGRSIVPLLKDEASPAARRRAVLLQVGPGCNGYDGIRTARYTYVEYRGKQTADGGCTIESRELFDLKRDPYELRSVLANPASASRYAAVQKDLDARLERLKTCNGTMGKDACE